MPGNRIKAPALVTFLMMLAGGVSLGADRQLFDDGWRFNLGDAPDAGGTLNYDRTKAALLKSAAGRPAFVGGQVSFAQADFDDSAWRQLNLPHDFGIESEFKINNPADTGKLTWWGVAWYRKTFTPPATSGQRHYLDIDGAMSYSTVWCDGGFVGGWPYGYTSYRVDLTPFFRPGERNVIAIRLDNPPSSSRWYPGGGIYRNVWLVSADPVHIDQWGTTITTLEADRAQSVVDVRSTVVNNGAKAASVSLQISLFEADPEGNPTGSAIATATQFLPAIAPESQQVSQQQIKVAAPKRWSPESPNRYVAMTTVLKDGKAIDTDRTPFGIRTARFDADKGFLLNDEPVELKGVCMHSDLGALGMAIHPDAIARRIALLKEMGCNAIRLSHNPPAPEFLDLCDRLGMLVIDEAFDCWINQKNKNDYHTLFVDWHEKDLRAMIRRDRNHPSVILWSIGNEVGEQWWKNGPEIAAGLTKIVHEEDPTRPATAAFDQPPSGWNGIQNSVDVFGYNYKPGLYAKVHAGSPNLPLLGSETASCFSSRGEYYFPLSQTQRDFQITSFDTAHPGWGSDPDLEFKSQDQNPYVCGEFVWTGFDYLGEPTPYNADMTILSNFSDAGQKTKMEKQLKELGKIKTPSRSSYFGIFDLCGFKKDRFYLYQARWRPELPMAHLMPHWTWPGREGQPTPVQVYTSGDEAELFVNGQSQGRKKRGRFDYRLRWDNVTYAPGELKVIAYRNGQQWAEDSVRTAGAAAKIELSVEPVAPGANGQLRFVTVRVTDAAGLVVPQAKNVLTFLLSGGGEIVATDNGNAVDLTSFQSHTRSAFNGMAQVIVQTKPGATGPIELTATGDSLTRATVRIDQ